MFTCMSMEVSALRITLYYKLLIKLYFLEFFLIHFLNLNGSKKTPYTSYICFTVILN